MSLAAEYLIVLSCWFLAFGWLIVRGLVTLFGCLVWFCFVSLRLMWVCCMVVMVSRCY